MSSPCLSDYKSGSPRVSIVMGHSRPNVCSLSHTVGSRKVHWVVWEKWVGKGVILVYDVGRDGSDMG